MPGFLDLISERVLGGLNDPYSKNLRLGDSEDTYGDFLSMLFGRGGKPDVAPKGSYGDFLRGMQGKPARPAVRSAFGAATNIAQPPGAPVGQSQAPAAPVQLPVQPLASRPPGPSVTPYGDIYQQVGQDYNIPPEVLSALGQIESGHNPQAVSPTGQHLGIGQIEASWFAPGENPFDPRTNIDKMALVLLTKLQQALQDKPQATWEDAVARYYGGTLEQPLSPEAGIPGPDTLGYVELWRQAMAGGA